MEVFVQQLINGLTLGSIYGLIAIGYTMVFGIIGMVNFAHGDVFMISTFVALIFFMLITTLFAGASAIVLVLMVAVLALGWWLVADRSGRGGKGRARAASPATIVVSLVVLGGGALALATGAQNLIPEGIARSFAIPATLILIMLLGMFFTGLWNWTIERVAYRPLRGSFRLAPLISAIGMSIFLMNLVQVIQGPRNKSVPQMLSDTLCLIGESTALKSCLFERVTTYQVNISHKQIVIILFTSVLLAGFWWLVQKTPLGRAQRACEQDMKMASLLGVDVNRTISLTFVMGAALAAVAGTMYILQYGVVNFADGFTPGVKAFTAAVLGGIGSLPGAVLGGLLIGLIEVMWSAYFSIDYKDVAAFSILAIALIFLPSGILGRPEVEKV